LEGEVSGHLVLYIQKPWHLTTDKLCAKVLIMTTEPLDYYRKTYHLRLSQGNRANSIEVTFPYQVVDREARKRNLTVEQFIELFQCVASFNGSEGVLYTFEEITQNGKTN
jgi:hypothetical protein